MKVLVACEESQAVTKQLRALGHEAYSCDIQECSGGHPEWHCQEDVLPLLNGNCTFITMDGVEHNIDGKWDLIIAHPPCTYLTNAGTRHFSRRINPEWKVLEREEKRREAFEFFMKFINADCEKIAVENPVGYPNSQYRKADQIIHPYYFADSKEDKENYYTKRTCLWLKGLKPLARTNDLPTPEPMYICEGEKCKGKKIGWCEGIRGTTNGQQGRAKARSKTFPGIAKAMAEQWAGDANLKEKENKEMELKIYNPTEDGFIKSIDWNHEEIKKEVSEKVEYYKNLVYTDDQIKEAKADRATLRKFVDALETKRKEIKKQCLAPYEVFEKQMKEIVAIVNEPVALIDSQVKGYEEKQKEEKKAKIVEIFDSIRFQPFVKLEMIWDERWLNASVTLKKIEEQMKELMYKFSNDLLTLSKLPEFGFEATEVYKVTLDINKALEKAQSIAEIAKRKAEYEAEQARKSNEAEEIVKMQSIKQEFTQAMNPPVEECPDVDTCAKCEKSPCDNTPEVKQWVKFQALLSTENALALKQFFKDRNIDFKAI